MFFRNFGGLTSTIFMAKPPWYVLFTHQYKSTCNNNEHCFKAYKNAVGEEYGKQNAKSRRK